MNNSIDYLTILEVLKGIAYLVLFGASVVGWMKNNMRNNEKGTADKTEMKIMLQSIKDDQSDIKNDIRDLKKSSTDTDKRLSVIEEQIKVANHRIDDLEKGR